VRERNVTISDAMQNFIASTDEHGHERGIGHDGEAVLFNAGARALGAFGFSNLAFDIGGKKSRRRYATATSPDGEECSIWIKSAFLWVGMAHVIRFPWSKRAVHGDDLPAILFAADDAIRRGGTHLLAIVGDAFVGRADVAHLYSLEQMKRVAIEQKAACRYPYYVNHGAALIIRSHHPAFDGAESIARSFGQDILTRPSVVPSRAPLATSRSGHTYIRDPKVRESILKMANGHCERCAQRGFLTARGEYYLETHHIVGVSERGPDTIDNIIALCPTCHRQAHFGADRVRVENECMQAIRRRKPNRT
jgi:hypothetical protein